MPEDKQITAPNVLPEHAQGIWRAAFDDAYTGTCKARGSVGQQEACAAASAWTAVKEGYQKSGQGEWIERTFEDRGLKAGKAPLPMSLYQSPASAGILWIRAYDQSLQSTKDITEAVLRAWDTLKSKYTNGAGGIWVIRNDVTVVPASAEAEEVEMAEPIVNRSVGAGASYQMQGTSILTDAIAYEDFDAVIAKYGDELSARPEDWDWENWSNLPMTQRTVRAVLNHRLECRAYAEGVKRSKKHGWTGRMNQNGSGEIIFRGWNDQNGRRTFSSMVLVSRIGTGTKPEDWEMQILSNTQSSTLMARVAPGFNRFRGPVIK